MVRAWLAEDLFQWGSWLRWIGRMYKGCYGGSCGRVGWQKEQGKE